MYSQRIVDEHNEQCKKLMEMLPWGPWKNEPHRVEFESHGLRCLLSRNPVLGQWCGYVGVPPLHPAYKQDELGLKISVHGGATYGSECHGWVCHKPVGNEPDSLFWIGFDCGHFGDLIPGVPFELPGHSYKEVDYVIKECKELARQLSEMRLP